MTSLIPALFRLELRRMMTLPTIVLPFLLMLLAGAFMAATSIRNSFIEVPTMLVNFVGGMVVVFGVPLLAVGMVAADVKDHWLRTLLMRPVTRSEYLIARMAAVFVLAVATILIAGIVPILVLPTILNKPAVWMFSRSIPALFFLLGHAYLILVLLTMLSCWLPGIVNVVMLGLWAMLSSVAASYVRWEWWDNGVVVTAAEFLFPSGFLEAAELSAEHSGDPMNAALWGISAAVCFTALAMWSVNRMQVEGGSE